MLPLAILFGVAWAVPATVSARGVDPQVAHIPQGKPQTGLRVVPLMIQTRDGKRHDYKVEVAKTAEQQAHGMMFRTQMARDTGMIFPMKPAREASFWMENTLISLDLVFVAPNGTVRNIAANAQPLSRAPLSSVGAIAAVLELKGGEAARIGLQPGDKVQW